MEYIVDLIFLLKIKYLTKNSPVIFYIIVFNSL